MLQWRHITAQPRGSCLARLYLKQIALRQYLVQVTGDIRQIAYQLQPGLPHQKCAL